jgi:phosphoribosylanthranilate isomerase
MERVQIAGIHDIAEANCCLDAGVRQLGFPLMLDVHEEDCSTSEVAEICRLLPWGVEKVLITYLDCAQKIAALCAKTGISLVQLHGHIDFHEVVLLKKHSPGLRIIKSLIVRDGNCRELVASAELWSPLVDAFITDTYDPKSGASGATGQTHDWEVSRLLVQQTDSPIYLAGGLNPGNVARAIHTVRPWGVDCHTGVEDEKGRKAPDLLKVFLQEVQRAFGEIGR